MDGLPMYFEECEEKNCGALSILSLIIPEQELLLEF